jgi:bla regulator protein BlaR1
VSAWGIAGTLARASVEGGLFVAGVWVLCRLIPRLPAALRCGLWWAACLKLLLGLLPIPGVALPVLPAAAGASVESSKTFLLRSADAPSRTLTPGPSPFPWPPPSQGEGKSIPWREMGVWILSGLWIVGLLIITRKALLELRHTRRIVRSAEPVQEGWVRTAFAGICARLGLRRAPELLGSGEVRTPQVTGLAQPVVLIPRVGFERLTPPEVSMMLCHELVHLRRKDLWLGWVPALAHRIFFFHPLAALAAREYAIAREAACDAEVLRILGTAPQAYGRLLLRWGVAPRETGLAAAGASPSLQTLKRRLQMLQSSEHIASDPRGKRRVSGWWWLAGALVLAGLIPLRMVAQEPAPPAPAAAPAPEATPAPEAVAAPEAPEATPAPEAVEDGAIGGVSGGIVAGVQGGAEGGVEGAIAEGVSGGVGDSVGGPAIAPVAPVAPQTPRTPRPARAPRASDRGEARGAVPAVPPVPPLPALAPRAALPSPTPRPALAPLPPPPPPATPRPGMAPRPVAKLAWAPTPAPATAPTPRAYGALAQPPAPPAPPAPPRPPAPPKHHGYSYHSGGDDSYVLMYGGSESVTMSGDSDDLPRVKRLRGDSKSDFLWFRHGGKEYVVHDGALLQRVKELSKAQGELGARQGELGGRQGALGAKQGALGARQGALGAEQGTLASERARRGDGDDRDLDKKEKELDAKMEDLGRQQEALGKQQEELGRQQEILGQQQEELSRKSEKEMHELIDRAIKTGAAQEVK